VQTDAEWYQGQSREFRWYQILTNKVSLLTNLRLACTASSRPLAKFGSVGVVNSG